MKIAIAGGNGFIGKALTKELLAHHHQVVILTRNKGRQDSGSRVEYVQWLSKETDSADALENTDLFINLAGESLNSGRWTKGRKERILSSRIDAVAELLTIINNMQRKPQALINASAVGFYGTSATDVFTEESQPGDDFLARTVEKWEQAAMQAEQMGIRTVLCRFGIVLDKQEGALPKMALPYKTFIGGTIGTGTQWVSWIHLADAVKALLFVSENKQIEGPVNFTAPHPVQMKKFGKVLGSILHRPHWLPIPDFALQLLLGEMSTLLLDGQKVLPQRLIEIGFSFQFSSLPEALTDIFS